MAESRFHARRLEHLPRGKRMEAIELLSRISREVRDNADWRKQHGIVIFSGETPIAIAGTWGKANHTHLASELNKDTLAFLKAYHHAPAEEAMRHVIANAGTAKAGTTMLRSSTMTPAGKAFWTGFAKRAGERGVKIDVNEKINPVIEIIGDIGGIAPALTLEEKENRRARD